jgi:hypothetical protein
MMISINGRNPSGKVRQGKVEVAKTRGQIWDHLVENKTIENLPDRPLPRIAASRDGTVVCPGSE